MINEPQICSIKQAVELLDARERPAKATFHGTGPLTFRERIKIREWYAARALTISNTSGGWGLDKYSIPWLNRMSPIERIAFDECVSNGLVMYPEFPIGNRFADLANPRLKWVIELDGKQHDELEDYKRDIELSLQGWTTFRVKARDCFKNVNLPSDTAGQFEWYSFFESGGINALAYALKRLSEYGDSSYSETSVDCVSLATLEAWY